jgi:hypothetical protein
VRVSGYTIEPSFPGKTFLFEYFWVGYETNPEQLKARQIIKNKTNPVTGRGSL